MHRGRFYYPQSFEKIFKSIKKDGGGDGFPLQTTRENAFPSLLWSEEAIPVSLEFSESELSKMQYPSACGTDASSFDSASMMP